jgi:hypothetical protein
MERKHLQQTYERAAIALQEALAALDAARDDASDDALAHLDEVPLPPPKGEDRDDEEPYLWTLAKCSRC